MISSGLRNTGYPFISIGLARFLASRRRLEGTRSAVRVRPSGRSNGLSTCSISLGGMWVAEVSGMTHAWIANLRDVLSRVVEASCWKLR